MTALAEFALGLFCGSAGTILFSAMHLRRHGIDPDELVAHANSLRRR